MISRDTIENVFKYNILSLIFFNGREYKYVAALEQEPGNWKIDMLQRLLTTH